MCIIVSKPANIPMVEWKTLKNCWKNNPDGGGFMYAANNRVYIQKGFMTWKSFRKALENLASVYSLDELPLVMHFRISTQGGVNPQNTHPFPISNDLSKLVSPKVSSTIGGMAHNGIIPKYSHYGTPSAYSDTLLFVKEAVHHAIHHPRDLENTKILEALENIAKSKLAFLSPNGDIKLLGSFNTENGVSFSNYTWYSFKKYYYSNGSSYAPYTSWYDYEDACYPYEDEYDYSDAYIPLKYRHIGEIPCMRVWECDPDIHNHIASNGEHKPLPPGCFFDSWGFLWLLDGGKLVACDKFVYGPDNSVVREFPKNYRVFPVKDGYEGYINDFSTVTYVKP